MYYLIFNPAAGNGHSGKVCEKVQERLRALGKPFTVLATERPGHAEELARKASSQNAEAVLCIGGDGTVSETVRGMLGSGVPLGIIPAGTGNDFIKTLSIPQDPMAALEVALTGEPRKTDAGVINGKAFANECGTGFDVTVLDYAEKAKKIVKGILPYLYGVICTILHYKPVRVTYSMDDGEEKTEDVLVIGAGNGRIIGGGICICPEAVPDDGNLDIMIVKDVKKSRLPGYLVKLLRGQIMTIPEAVHFKAKHVKLRCPGMRMNIDGEIIRMDEADITLSPGGLTVIRP